MATYHDDNENEREMRAWELLLHLLMREIQSALRGNLHPAVMAADT